MRPLKQLAALLLFVLMLLPMAGRAQVYPIYLAVYGDGAFAASTVDIVTRYTDVCEGSDEFCADLQTAVFWVQMASLSGDAVASNMAHKYSGKAIAAQNQANSTLWTNTEKAEVINLLEEFVRLGSRAGSTLGTIVRVGNKIEYTNPAGKLLKWSEQSTNDITNSINAAKNITDVGRKLEGTVADFIKQEGKTVEGFGVKVKNANNQAVTDLDILTQNEIIEVKNSYSAWSSKPEQVNRFVNSTLDDFVNPYNKKAILYIETPLTQAQKTTILNTIPNNVTIVNSLNELKIILQ